MLFAPLRFLCFASRSPIDVHHSPKPKLVQFPYELIEVIFYHLSHNTQHRYYTGPLDDLLIGEYRQYLCVVSLVCKQWASVAQTILWKSVGALTNEKAERILASPVFGQHHVTRLVLWHVSEHNVNSILGTLNNLRELQWGRKNRGATASWWNNENLASLLILELYETFQLPRDAKPRFRLKRLSITIPYVEFRDLQGGDCKSIVDSCAQTLEMIAFDWENRSYVPAWFDRSKSPLLRSIQVSIYPQILMPSEKDLAGATCVVCHYVSYGTLLVPNPLRFPSTLESIKVRVKLRDGDRWVFRDFVWPGFFTTLLADCELAVPSLRSIDVCIYRTKGVRTFPRLKISAKQAREESRQVEITKSFWQKRKVKFDTWWTD